MLLKVKTRELVKVRLSSLLFIFILVPVISCTPDQNVYERLALRYADFMIEQGTDHYGEIHSPAFVSMLNRKNDSIYHDPEHEIFYERAETGIREIDRSWNGVNPFNDEALYELLYAISEDTQDKKYKNAADESLKWMLINTQHSKTKLIGWGEHLGYRVDTDEIVRHEESEWADLKHEIHGYWGLWEKIFELTPQISVEYAHAFWNYHVYDKDSILHAHQTRYDKYDPDVGFIFPRMAGHMIFIWSLAYQYAEDSSVRADMLNYIDQMVTTHNEKRVPGSNALMFYHPKEGIVYKPYGNLEAVFEVHQALSLSLPDSVLKKLETFNRLSDQVVLDSISIDLDNLWCNRYGVASSLGRRGMHVMNRFLQNRDDRFKDIALKMADRFIGVEPQCTDYPIWPRALSKAIDLQLEAYALTNDKKYIDQAFIFGEFGRELFIDDQSPLPKAFSRDYDHYEAITGGADLMLSLYRLSKFQSSKKQ